jgi:uncharacterized membrane protein YphA (DoxX/SURF4 family)
MKSKAMTGARILLGLIYFVFGLNGFLQFLPPKPMSDAAAQFAQAMVQTGYFFPVLKSTEVIGGALLLTGLAVPLALLILAPITIQIVLFHLFLTPGFENQIMSIAMVTLHLLSAIAYWPLYRPLFKGTPKAQAFDRLVMRIERG